MEASRFCAPARSTSQSHDWRTCRHYNRAGDIERAPSRMVAFNGRELRRSKFVFVVLCAFDVRSTALRNGVSEVREEIELRFGREHLIHAFDVANCPINVN
jgi:hypothetical protein